MIRKISTKVPSFEDKSRKPDLKTSDNQYYLPHPQIRIVKTPIKQISLDHQKDKNVMKYPRKCSQNAPLRTFSIANFKTDTQNLSKQHDPALINKNNAAKKVESRKFRSSSNCETPKKSLSKSGFKLQLNSLKKDGVPKRLNLKIETPTPKKGQLHEMNFDSYYNNDHPHVESKTVRGMMRNGSNNSYTSSNTQFNVIFNRCKKLIEDYEQQLQSAKKQNKALLQQNCRLKERKQGFWKD